MNCEKNIMIVGEKISNIMKKEFDSDPVSN